MFGPTGESSYTKAIQSLLADIQHERQPDKALFGQAATYFCDIHADTQKINALHHAVEALKPRLDQAPNRHKEKLMLELKHAQSELKKARLAEDKQRLARLNNALQVCKVVIRLSEGADWQETQVLSAKFLGTLYLLSPRQGNKLAYAHTRFKPLYKAVLAVRLLDASLRAGNVSNQYILSQHDPDNRYSDKKEELTRFQSEVVIPLILASIFQDIGIQHPDAQAILKGKSGSMDEFRLLDQTDRIELLRISHAAAESYLEQGLGQQSYIGNSKHERENFRQQEARKTSFIRTVLADAVAPKQGLGNLIKAPQIYTSVIMSTKPDYDIKQLPKAALLLEKVAKTGSISETAARNLMAVVGHFPQGFGITFLVQKDKDKYSDCYEYCIVNHLNPDNVREPKCRAVTRNLGFIASGQDVRVSIESNLYYPLARKKLEVVNPARLQEILTLLYHNYEHRKELELIPACWEPYDYFTFIKHQNLWNKKPSVAV